MTFAEQVALALGRAETAISSASAEMYRRTPDPVGYALGWVVANAIVMAHYRSAGIDVLPSYDSERGWDRFLITRRVACWRCGNDRAGYPGVIMIDASDGPVLVCPTSDTPLRLRSLLWEDPEQGMRAILDHLALPALPMGVHADCWHEVATSYPTLYGAITELVLEHQGVVAAREIFVDDREIDGTFHPLYVHGVVTSPRVVYDWCVVETGRYAAYIRIDGRSALYATDAGGWSTVRKPLIEEDGEGVSRRLKAWLRIAGRPDPEGVD